MRQAVCSVCLIFLCFVAVLGLGLLACERGLQEVSGLVSYPGVLALNRAGEQTWLFTFADRQIVLDLTPLAQLWRRFTAQ
ncbi:MAG: hypothetical protein KGZ57_11210 [Dethiobacter sp.]|nr:hypothetical protein [Dethiobacter sp.]